MPTTRDEGDATGKAKEKSPGSLRLFFECVRSRAGPQGTLGYKD